MALLMCGAPAPHNSAPPASTNSHAKCLASCFTHVQQAKAAAQQCAKSAHHTAQRTTPGTASQAQAGAHP